MFTLIGSDNYPHQTPNFPLKADLPNADALVTRGEIRPEVEDERRTAMNLPAELFNEITSSINVLGRDEPRAADRRSPRVRLSSHLAVSPWGDPLSPQSMRVRDISTGGVGIFHSERIGLDEQIVVRFPLQDGNSTLVLGTVVYWEPLAERLFGIGVQFERLVEESEMVEQKDQTTRQHNQEIGVMARLTQAFARTWRIAS